MIVPPLLQYIVSSLLIISFAQAQGTWPGAVPLAIRSPHFNSWLPGPGKGHWSTFWNDRTLGWIGAIKIDGVTWVWLGQIGNGTTLVKTEVTPTRTILTLTAGPMDLEVTFLSPIEPTDLVRQSFPFTYMYLTANATDGANHSVQLYTDITAEWVSGDQHTSVTWSTTPNNDLIYHQVQRESPSPMQEIKDQAEDATVYYAMANGPNVTWQTGAVALRGHFGSAGERLPDTEDKDFRAISDNWPIFAFSVDFGDITEISTPVVWALGVVRDPTIRYGSGDGTIQLRSSFFWTQYSTIGDAIDAFIKDFPNARQRAIDLDQKITSDALSISQDYADLVSLSVRQTMSGIDITTSKGSDGQWNTSDVMMFMKSVGDTSRRVNPTEFMFAALPAYLYLNASWAGFLLRSSLQQQAATLPASAYAMPDLGSTYPIALGNNSVTSAAEALAIESSGNMIVMTLAHAKASGDGSLISNYYSLLKSWANYLVINSLNRTEFITSDGQNNPNLAIKGIIGIRAMGEISQIVGQADDASRFKDQASTMLEDWENRTILSNHVTSTYGQSASWGLIYNLFPDSLLKLDFITQEIYNNQTEFYAMQIPTAGKYGIEYDNGAPKQAKSHWTMLTAATTTDNSTRDSLVSLVHSRAWLNTSALEFPTDYNPMSGTATGTGGRSSPAQGAMFALLALNLPERSIQASIPGGSGSSGGGGENSKPNVGVIVGATVGAAVTIGLLAGVCLLLWRRHQERKVPASSLYTFTPHVTNIASAEDTHNRHSWDEKGYINPWQPSLAPSDSLTLNPLRKQLESGPHRYPWSHSTSISRSFDADDPPTRPVSPISEFSPDGRLVLHDSEIRTLPPPSRATASIASVPTQVDVTRWLRHELETQLRGAGKNQA